MQKYVPIILAILAILALGYLFMNNDGSSNQPSQTMRNTPMSSKNPSQTMRNNPMTSNHPSQTMRNTPMHTGIENFESAKKPHSTKKSNSNFEDVETFVDTPQQQSVSGSEEIQYIEQPYSLGQTETGSQLNQLPSECYPKDVLSSVDLLPRDANSLWAQVNPSGQGSLADQNFLTSGFHIGINTVGQTLRNANRQLRSEPLNPQVKVSPWMQTTIDPDINRRPLEINSGDL